MKAVFVAATAVLLNSAFGEIGQVSLQATGKDLVSVGTVSQILHHMP